MTRITLLSRASPRSAPAVVKGLAPRRTVGQDPSDYASVYRSSVVQSSSVREGKKGFSESCTCRTKRRPRGQVAGNATSRGAPRSCAATVADRCSLVCRVGLCVRSAIPRPVIKRPEPEIVRPTPPCRGTTTACTGGARPARARRSRAHGTRVASCLSSGCGCALACSVRCSPASAGNLPGPAGVVGDA
jgi:hypothetical protein